MDPSCVQRTKSPVRYSRGPHSAQNSADTSNASDVENSGGSGHAWTPPASPDRAQPNRALLRSISMPMPADPGDHPSRGQWAREAAPPHRVGPFVPLSPLSPLALGPLAFPVVPAKGFCLAKGFHVP